MPDTTEEERVAKEREEKRIAQEREEEKAAQALVDRLRKDKQLKPEESVKAISYCVSLGFKRAQLAREKDVTIIIGNTGAGKSTLVNYLHGCLMKYKKVKIEQNDGSLSRRKPGSSPTEDQP